MTEETVTANLYDNDFIELTFLRENAILDINEVIEGWEKAKQLSPNKKSVVLLKTGRWTLLEKDARDYVINELKTWSYVAIVLHNLGQRIMGQVVIKMTGRGNHIKLFENDAKAKEWLKGKLSKNKLLEKV